MDENDWLAGRFEEHRAHLRGVAYRMLGSLSEADDAVQEAWLRLSRADSSGVANLRAWLTTVVSRVALDMLRARKARSEHAMGELAAAVPEPSAAVREAAAPAAATDPEQEAVLADTVGVALLVVLQALGPAERIAFVLHDLFGVAFEEIAQVVGRSPEAARQLASRARRRVHGAARVSDDELAGQRQVVGAFLSALRAGDFDALVAVLDPDVVVRIDGAASGGAPRQVRGAEKWARGAIAFARTAPATQMALIDGDVGAVLAPGGRLLRAMRFTVRKGRIAEIEIVGEPARVQQFEVAVLEEP